MQQRYYDPIAGRFLSVDPVTTDAKTGDSFNRYVYGNNNPYKFKDPDGRFAQAIFGIVVGGISGYIGGLNSGAQGMDLARATGIGMTVGFATAIVPVGGSVIAAGLRNALTGGAANAAGQVAGGAKLSEVSGKQVAVQAGIAAVSAGTGNLVGRAVAGGVESAQGAGVATTVAIGAGAAANAFTSSDKGGLQPQKSTPDPKPKIDEPKK
jgi:uncharacterized protein RhaS with RHS repeats